MQVKKLTIDEIQKIIPVDHNATFSGLINFASWGVKDEVSAFQVGFRYGYDSHFYETIESFKKYINEKNNASKKL